MPNDPFWPIVGLFLAGVIAAGVFSGKTVCERNGGAFYWELPLGVCVPVIEGGPEQRWRARTGNG